MNKCPDITCPDNDNQHHKQSNLTKVKCFALFHRHIKKVLADISNELSTCQSLVKNVNRHEPVGWRNCPLNRSALQKLPENVSCMRNFRHTSCRMKQAHCGPFLPGSFLHSVFIWLQVAVNLVALPLKNQFFLNNAQCLEFATPV